MWRSERCEEPSPQRSRQNKSEQHKRDDVLFMVTTSERRRVWAGLPGGKQESVGVRGGDAGGGGEEFVDGGEMTFSDGADVLGGVR